MVSVRRVAPVLLLLLALPIGAASKKSTSTRPPRHLHKVGDHWTAYNPPDPSTYPTGSKVHTIAKGDTLWDLARTYYSNPYLWPQLWEANTYITDSHWIYPGDTLLVQGETGSPVGQAESDTGTTTETESTTASNAARPLPLGNEADLFCWGYLGDPNESLPARIASFDDTELKYIPGDLRQTQGVANNDVVYVTGSAAGGLVAGESYMVVTPRQLVKHPKTKAVVGRHYDFRGRAKVLCINGDMATVMITNSCTDMHVGDRLKPIPVLPIPLARLTPLPTFCDPASGKANGFIVHAKDFTYSIGKGGVVEINLGKDDLVQPGDFLTVFRESPVAGNPRQVLGEIGVLTAESRTATGAVVQMRNAIRVGDRVEVK